MQSLISNIGEQYSDTTDEQVNCFLQISAVYWHTVDSVAISATVSFLSEFNDFK